MPDPCLFPIFVRQGKSRTRHKVGYINGSGQTIIDPLFSDGTSFNEGLAAVKVGKFWGVIDGNGSFIIQPRLPDFCRFNEGLAPLSMRKSKG
jgi:hypothetical protein